MGRDDGHSCRLVHVHELHPTSPNGNLTAQSVLSVESMAGGRVPERSAVDQRPVAAISQRAHSVLSRPPADSQYPFEQLTVRESSVDQPLPHSHLDQYQPRYSVITPHVSIKPCANTSDQRLRPDRR